MERRSLLWITFVYISFCQAFSAPCTNNPNIEITSTILDGSVRSIYYFGEIIGPNDSHNWRVLVLTWSRTVWLSKDTGRHWEGINSLMARSNESGSDRDGPGIRAMVSSADPNTFYFIGPWGSGLLWVTKDGGDSFELNDLTLYLPYLDQFTPHPLVSGWVLASQFSCVVSNVRCNENVWLSTDTGATWSLIETYVGFNNDKVLYSWGDAGRDGVSNKTVYMVHHPNKTGNQLQFSFNVGSRILSVSDNLWESGSIKQAFGAGIVDILWDEEWGICWIGILDSGSTKLAYSKGGDFIRMIFPRDENNDLTEQGYLISTANEFASFISVAHGNNRATTYYADLRDDGLNGTSNFVLTLERTRINDDFSIDFYPFQGLDELIFSNSFTTTDILMSLMTSDNGGDWNTISNTDDTECTGICNLQIWNSGDPNIQNRNRFSTPLSVAEAIGHIIVTGSVGSSFDANTAATYYSRDAGVTWENILSTGALSRISDNGNLILLMEKGGNSSQISYTIDQALNWESCSIFDSPDAGFVPLVIRSEPTYSGEEFVIFGTMGSKQIVVYLNFEKVFPRACQGVDSPGSSTSDYEYFTPIFPEWEDSCVNGHNVTFVRRKRDSNCFNPYQWDKNLQNYGSCACTIRDYSCDFCYVKTVRGDCIPDPSCTATSGPPSSCVPGQFYNKTRGYRLAPGNACVGGLDMGPVLTPCPANSTLPSTCPLSSPCPSPVSSPCPQCDCSPGNVQTNDDDHDSSYPAAVTLGVLFAVETCCVVVVVSAVAFRFWKTHKQKKTTSQYKAELVRDISNNVSSASAMSEAETDIEQTDPGTDRDVVEHQLSHVNISYIF